MPSSIRSSRVSDNGSITKPSAPAGVRPSAWASAARIVPACATATMSEPAWAAVRRPMARVTLATTCAKLSPSGGAIVAGARQKRLATGSAARSPQRRPCQAPKCCSARSGSITVGSPSSAAAVCRLRRNGLATTTASAGSRAASPCMPPPLPQSASGSACPTISPVMSTTDACRTHHQRVTVVRLMRQIRRPVPDRASRPLSVAAENCG